MPESITYLTEDRVELTTGDRAYDYYSMKPGIIGSDSGWDGTPEYNPTTYGDPRFRWFYFMHDDGSRTLLDGERICSVAYAKRQGFPNPEGIPGREFEAEMTPAQRRELKRIEDELGLADAVTAKRGLPAYVDVEGRRTYQIATDGFSVDVTEAIAADPEYFSKRIAYQD